MKNPILRSMLWSAACLLLTVSASSAKSPERTSGYVGIRPLPRSAGESKIDWMSGIGYYDSLLRPDDFTAKYTDVIKDYRGAFATRKCFFEHYLPLDRDWIDMNPETNPLILKIRSREKIGMEVEHILICREAELLGRGKWGPFKEDSRILYQRDVDDYRKLFKLAYKQGLTKHKNYKLIQMVTHASAFMEIPDKEFDQYTDFIERDWLYRFWKEGLPKHHPNMHYYLNAFPHAHGAKRPVGPESDPHSYLGMLKWLIQEIKGDNPQIDS